MLGAKLIELNKKLAQIEKDYPTYNFRQQGVIASFLTVFHPIETQAMVLSYIGRGIDFTKNKELKFAAESEQVYVPDCSEVLAHFVDVNAFIFRMQAISIKNNKDIQEAVGEDLFHIEPFMVYKLLSDYQFMQRTRTSGSASTSPTADPLVDASNDSSDDEGVSFFTKNGKGCFAKKK